MVRLVVCFVFLCFFNVAQLSTGQEMISENSRIVFLGDSITQAGARPGGYVSIVEAAIQENHPELKVEIVGAGISGNRVPDLQKRLTQDVLDKKPTTVVIYIGINDVWHSQKGRGTPKDKFESGLKDVIEQIKSAGANVVLCTPSVIGEKTDGSNPLDAMLEEYSAISRKVAGEMGVHLHDLRSEFITHLKEVNPDNKEKGVLTGDGVHLNPAGNQFVAHQMLLALGAKKKQKAVMWHIVLFKFADGLEQAKIDEIVKAFGELPKKIELIVDYEAGTNVSPENLDQGFTHAFVVTFKNAADRDAYLPHPAHKEFVKLLGGRIDKVLVFDFETK